MLGYVPVPVNGNANGTKASAQWKTEKRFRGLTLAQVGKILLSEHEKLHGREIELLAKAGGFKGAANHFQVYLPVAFKRDGGLENIGGNTWKLKEDPA